MALDSGATQTTIDLNMLLIDGWTLRDSIGQLPIETANGVVVADVFLIKEFSFGSLILENIPVLSIDFIAHGILSDYGGFIGIDILSQSNFCIDFQECQIIQSS